jgi:DNA-binding protein HU-beta
MNKAELAGKIAEKFNLSKKAGEEVVEFITETITSTLKSAGEVTLTGFGTFSAKLRAGRVGVNPQKPGEKIQIPPVTVPKFKAGKALKDALKGK